MNASKKISTAPAKGKTTGTMGTIASTGSTSWLSWWGAGADMAFPCGRSKKIKLNFSRSTRSIYKKLRTKAPHKGPHKAPVQRQAIFLAGVCASNPKCAALAGWALRNKHAACQPLQGLVRYRCRRMQKSAGSLEKTPNTLTASIDYPLHCKYAPRSDTSPRKGNLQVAVVQLLV